MTWCHSEQAALGCDPALGSGDPEPDPLSSHGSLLKGHGAPRVQM